MDALLEARAACLDALESTKALISQSEGEPNGYDVAYFLQAHDDEDDDVLNAALLYTPSGRLSALGVAKCTTLFHKFNTGHNGFMSYEEFIDYLASLGRSTPSPKDPLRDVIDNIESWKMYMSDAYNTTTDGDLTIQGFLLYREATEHLYPLAADLTSFGLPWIDDGLVRHMQLLTTFAAYDTAQIGKLPMAQLPYLLADAGVLASRRAVDSVVQQLRVFAECMECILQRNRAIRLFGYKQTSRIRLSDCATFIYRDAYVALALSSYTPPPLSLWSQALLTLQRRSYTVLRRLHASLRTLRTYIQRAARTGLLQLGRLLPSTYGEYTIKLDVGNPEFATSAEVHISFTTEVDSSATLHKLGYRHDGAECFLYLDFVARSDISDHALADTARAMQSTVDDLFHDHFASMPYYHSTLVVTPSRLETHGSPVVRVVLLFTDALDPFNVFVDAGLPSMLQVHNLLASFEVHVALNVSARDLLTNKRFNVLEHLGLRAFAASRLGRQSVSHILEQVLRHSQYEAEATAAANAHLAREKATFKKPNSRRPTATATTWRDQVAQANAAALHRIWSMTRRLVSVIAFSKISSWNWVFPTLQPLFAPQSALKKLLPLPVFDKWRMILGTTGQLATLWRHAVTALQDDLQTMAREAPPTDAATSLDTYSVLVSNLRGLNAVQAQAGSMGIDLLLEGLDWIPLLPRP
ncbi:hypothetical protein SPRG_05073 [Saprolegnia parasitica CBS 223.65]|uniref:EF-hand domain-containing protein n=1 Tax=Saprolegnia parasitica (strain CBS 223.65) TaxID=695850 RepID=A0A067CU95_SAPPC|nr:hypothetical protein SPRG_05073 [Saprolegnia parasitica CBS 223.65]KDO30362.1 hypothetical protein SPRG_05073 [Saprolegnia parasitica CBS 223.65]|eukprot:XP_012198972.1 hypothetical protein SPRG_05073 [Saprolegnia parasitica CBS 223.65]